jgi:hypothetical protein
MFRFTREGNPFEPRKLEQTLASERSAYINARINAAIGLCPEPTHPLDRVVKPKTAREASHAFKPISLRPIR